MRFLFSPYGRTNRKGIWFFTLIYVVLSGASVVLDQLVDTFSEEMSLGLFESLISLFFLWPSIAVSVRRFHDLNMTGWWVLWFSLLSILLGAIASIVTWNSFGFGLEGVESLDENTPIAEYPVFLWILIGAASIPWLFGAILLYFFPGKKGETRFELDRRQTDEQTDQSPPWID